MGNIVNSYQATKNNELKMTRKVIHGTQRRSLDAFRLDNQIYTTEKRKCHYQIMNITYCEKKNFGSKNCKNSR
ncbi:hypothetical protein Hanom_Chr11g00991231 [Helianthus anomalus]